MSPLLTASPKFPKVITFQTVKALLNYLVCRNITQSSHGRTISTNLCSYALYIYMYLVLYKIYYLHIITDPHQKLLSSLSIISANAENKIMEVDFVKFCLLNSLI